MLAAPGSAAQDPYQTIQALESSRSLGGETLAGFLTAPDPAVAMRAALAIGRVKQAAGARLLSPHLGERSPGLRAMVIFALGLLGAGDQAPEIAAALSYDSSPAVRIAALDALGRLETAQTLRGAEPLTSLMIVAALHGDRNSLVRARAATALEAFRNGAMGDFASRELIKAFKAERDQDVRWHIMWTIFRGYAIRVPRAFLTKALHDKNEVVRIEAVRAYGRLKNKDAIPALAPLTQDPSWRVQLQASESLKALRGQSVTEHLTAFPASTHTPPSLERTYKEIVPLPRPAVTGKAAAPTPSQVLYQPKLLPEAPVMNGPVPGPHPQIRVSTTKGTFILKLYPEWAPLTVANFLNLANRGYYDGLRWFRIVPDFVAQTGDPNDNGEGDAGYTIPAEENPLEQRSGVLSMGLNYEGDHPVRDSAGTQFYITLSPQLHLNRDFTVFGEVTGGFQVLGRLIESDRMIKVEQIPDTKE